MSLEVHGIHQVEKSFSSGCVNENTMYMSNKIVVLCLPQVVGLTVDFALQCKTAPKWIGQVKSSILVSAGSSRTSKATCGG